MASKHPTRASPPACQPADLLPDSRRTRRPASNQAARRPGCQAARQPVRQPGGLASLQARGDCLSHWQSQLGSQLSCWPTNRPESQMARTTASQAYTHHAPPPRAGSPRPEPCTDGPDMSMIPLRQQQQQNTCASRQSRFGRVLAVVQVSLFVCGKERSRMDKVKPAGEVMLHSA